MDVAVGWKGRGLVDVPVLIMGRAGKRRGGEGRDTTKDTVTARPEPVRVVSSLPLLLFSSLFLPFLFMFLPIRLLFSLLARPIRHPLTYLALP
jgi:hypothetical protein